MSCYSSSCQENLDVMFRREVFSVDFFKVKACSIYDVCITFSLCDCQMCICAVSPNAYFQNTAYCSNSYVARNWYETKMM